MPATALRTVPFRHSLLMRLLAASMAIASCSTAAAAWLAVQVTTRSIQQTQGDALSTDASIYGDLLGYAATHRTWDGVAATVRQLSVQTGRQITLTSSDHAPLAGYPQVDNHATHRFAVLDALDVDPALAGADSSRIDPRVLGPYRLDTRDRYNQQVIARRAAPCVAAYDSGSLLVEDVAGYFTLRPSPERPELDAVIDEKMRPTCYPDLAVPAAAERAALDQLEAAVRHCLRPGPDLAPSSPGPVEDVHLDVLNPDAAVQACVAAGRREQLRPYVAPAALLSVNSLDGTPQTRVDLTRSNVVKIVGTTGIVVLLTIAVTALVGARLVRPLRALTSAAADPSGRHGRVPVSGRDEIGVLATTLNALSERRELAEGQRTAMVHDVAHELRTPLTNIRSWLEAMEDGIATPASDPRLTAALLGEALQLQSIVDDLQDLATADAAGLTLSPRRLPLGRLLGDVMAAHRGSADAKSVTMTTTAPEGLDVLADPVRIRQALGNLVSNAIRHTPAGGTVTLSGTGDRHDTVIAVTDTGTGIAADDLPHIFDRFWRADSSRSRDTGGSGLGLSIVSHIVHAHGGSVRAESSLGRGTTIVLRLPRTNGAGDSLPTRAG